MDPSGFNFGVDPQELVLILVGFAMQNDFFELLYQTNNILGFLTYTFGMIGLASLLLLPANWTVKVVLSWLFLMIVVVARPVAEPFFFTDPILSNASIMNQPVCTGGVLSQKECAAIVGADAGVKVDDIVKDKLNTVDSSFLMFSPIAATLHVINSLREGIAVELSGIGANSIDKHITSIETIRRSATASNHATYALANFQATCGQRNSNFARIAALPLRKALENHASTVADMEKETLSPADALVMFDNYAKFKKGKGAFAPPLICAAESELDICADNAYSRNPVLPRLLDEDLQGVFGGGTILLNNQLDYNRVMATAAAPVAGSGAPTDATGLLGLEEVQENLEQEVFGRFGDDYDKIAKQDVTIAMPLNARPIVESRYSDTPAADLEGIINEIQDTSVETYREVGAIFGASLAGAIAIPLLIALGATCTAATLGACAVFLGGIGVAAYGGNLAGGAGGEGLAQEERARLLNKAVTLSDRGAVMAVETCSDLYQFTNMQLGVATINFSYLRRGLAEIISENEDFLKENGNKLMSLPARERMDYILNAALEREEKACEQLSDQPTTGGPGPARPSPQQRCINNKKFGQIPKMQALLRSERVDQSQAAVGAFLDYASDPKFSGQGFELASNLGEIAGPFGIWFKTILGGFGAGTYSAIMPVLVSYATALIIMMTPLLFMIGLAVPTWAFGVILLPIVVVAYFQLTKVIFVMIGIISSVFIAANDADLLTGLTSSFSDLVMATAYTASFLLTGIVMFALKNPFGAVQQLAGNADKTSTISGQEAFQMAGAAYGLSRIPGKVSGAVEGAHSAAGNASANLEANTGLDTSSFLGESAQQHRGQRLESIAKQHAEAQYQEGQTLESHQARASGRVAARQEQEENENFQGNNNAALVKPAPPGLTKADGQVIKTEPLNNAVDALKKAAESAGASFNRANLSNSKQGLGGQLDTKAHQKDGTVAHSFNADALRTEGVDVDKIVEKGGAEFFDDGKQIRIVQHRGLESQSHPGGPGNEGPGGGSGNADSGGGPSNESSGSGPGNAGSGSGPSNEGSGGGSHEGSDDDTDNN